MVPVLSAEQLYIVSSLQSGILQQVMTLFKNLIGNKEGWKGKFSQIDHEMQHFKGHNGKYITTGWGKMLGMEIEDTAC